MRSEDSVLALISSVLPQSRAVIGPGDDAAVLDLQGQAVVSTDVLVDNIHFRRDYSSAADIGYRCVAQNVADSAAMGARPVSLVVAVTTPADITDQWLEDMARGLAEACGDFGVTIDGGDLSHGATLSLCGTVIGDLEGKAPILRSGARLGDAIIHCGNLGHSHRGLKDLQSGVESRFADLFRRPQPPIDKALSVSAGAMMDVSDSLVRDASRISAASGLALHLNTDLIESVLDDGISLADALYGGEDHGFLATASECPDGWRVIGHVAAGSGVLIDGEEVTELAGWDHYSG